MVLEVLEGKIVFSECSRSICGIFEWQEVWRRRSRALAKTGSFLGLLVNFWSD
jgi:hypothetical protein